jgi:Domain of Unknown Function with PDB structure (DUF3857)/Transglutaminase-like superfamily
VSIRRSLLTLFCTLLCGFGIVSYDSPIVRAGDGFQSVSSEELKMTSEPLAPGAPAIILFRQVDRDDSGLTAHENNYVRIKILTEEGRKYADVEIPFLKEEGNNVVSIKARTIRPDGSIVNFQGKPFEKSIVKAKGLKYMAKTFTLPDVQVGGIIEYSYTIDLPELFLINSHWILSNELFTKRAKFSLKPYAREFNVTWTWQGLPEGSAQPKSGADNIIRLEVNNIPAFRTEDYMPPENELKARVDFAYSEDTFERDPVQFWKRKGKKLNDKVESFIGKRRAMEEAVARIVAPNDPPEVKLEKIYARVQQVRNTSYEVEKSEQQRKREKEKTASNVEEVWTKGYGNGTQLTWLFLALARAAGLEAYGVLASDRRNYFFNPSSMDSNRLDTNVVLVKVNGKDVYCDPGGAFTPLGLLMWPETGVTGLRLDKDGGAWIKTMVPESSASRVDRHANLTLAETGDLEGKLTITFTGLEGMKRRLAERNEDDTARKKSLEDEVKEYIPAASEVELTNKPDWSSSSTPLVAEYNLKIPGWGAKAGRRTMLPAGIFSATEKRVFDHTERVHPIYFEFPSEKLDDVTITLPPGWQVSSVPSPQDQAVTIVGYTLKVERDKGAVHLTRKLRLNLVLLETQYYPGLRDFFQMVRKGDEEQIVLLPGTASSSN